MKATDTISVNPSKTALGHSETPSGAIFRTPVIGADAKSPSLNLMQLVFPTTGAGVNEYKKYAVPLRTLLATILIAFGVTLLTSPVATLAAPVSLSPVAFAVCTLAFGAFLALGLFTRPVMAAASLFYCIIGALALRAGTPDLSVFSLMFGCAVFCILGAGKYSCDTLIRRSIMRHKISSTRKHKANCMGYKAFHKVNF